MPDMNRYASFHMQLVLVMHYISANTVSSCFCNFTKMSYKKNISLEANFYNRLRDGPNNIN